MTKLYHGTSESTAISALLNGILPQAESQNRGNWPDCPARDDLVYLTNSYAPYFAFHAASEANEKWAIIEVDTDRLDHTLLPDEDYLEQASRGQDLSAAFGDLGFPEGDYMHERTAWFRDHLESFFHMADASLEGIGNCAYPGRIPPDAITRIVIIDPEKTHLSQMAMDPSISLMNYRFCGSKYQALTRWFAGYEVSAEEIDPISSLLLEADGDAFPMSDYFENLKKFLKDTSALKFLKKWEGM